MVVLAIEEKNAGLRGNRDPDLVRHFQAAAALKILLRKENLNELTQLPLFARRKQTVVGHSFPQNAEPLSWKRPLFESSPPPFS
jgi:hypothetical protein